MAHAEKCPVCDGKGRVMVGGGRIKEYPTVEEYSTGCHGCQGEGWVTVEDSSPISYPFNQEEKTIFDSIERIAAKAGSKNPKALAALYTPYVTKGQPDGS